MKESHIDLNSEEFKAEIKVFSTWPDGTESHAYAQLITELIDNAATDFWEKHPRELQPDDFYATILNAIARCYAFMAPDDVADSARNLLIEYIDHLHKNGQLDALVTNEFEDDELDE